MGFIVGLFVGIFVMFFVSVFVAFFVVFFVCVLEGVIVEIVVRFLLLCFVDEFDGGLHVVDLVDVVDRCDKRRSEIASWL